MSFETKYDTISIFVTGGTPSIELSNSSKESVKGSKPLIIFIFERYLQQNND